MCVCSSPGVSSGFVASVVTCRMEEEPSDALVDGLQHRRQRSGGMSAGSSIPESPTFLTGMKSSDDEEDMDDGGEDAVVSGTDEEEEDGILGPDDESEARKYSDEAYPLHTGRA